jgi:glycosyltransferase involved in cell wall biosynthesis
MKKGMVSILIVSYNAEKYIKKTIQSCLAQTYQDFEILILDNASGDRTVEIIDNFNDPRITLIKGSNNIGPYAGLNFLLDRTKGEYIAIQDHDDIWSPAKITEQIIFLENNKDCIACGTLMFFYYESKEILVLNKKQSYTNFVDHPSLVFRDKSFRYDPKHALADELFEKKTLTEAGKIYCIQKPLAIHRIKRGGGNLSFSRFTFSAQNIKDFFSANRVNFKNIQYLTYLLISRFLSEKIIWLLRKKITLRNTEWISLDNFQKRFPEFIL